ncbi:MAG: MarR family transcriptional regulator, partial [Lachnospiraceae bacterium]|nr:MarR family transcriptional regulator [Lachnospiraceae bacterium]
MDLIRLFKEYGEKQETLLRLREDEALLALTNTEQHVVAAVGDLNAPNVTSIAEEMGLTKGAVSKNIKKLLSQGYVDAFQKEGNS